MTQTSPLGTVGRGLAAGAVATGVMTAYQMLVAKVRGQEEAAPPETWDDAPAPAQVGERVLSGVFHKEIELDQADRLTTVMHWAYGTGWGALYGLFQETLDTPILKTGAAFGTGVWAMSYAQLVPMGIYKPPWKYPVRELALDLSYHLVYGMTAAIAYHTLSG